MGTSEVWVAEYRGEVISAHTDREDARSAVTDRLVEDGHSDAWRWTWATIHSTKGNQSLTWSSGNGNRFHAYVYAVPFHA